MQFHCYVRNLNKSNVIYWPKNLVKRLKHTFSNTAFEVQETKGEAWPILQDYHYKSKVTNDC